MRAERALSRDATSAADLDAKLLFYYYARSSFSGAAVSRKTTPCHFNAQARAWKASWPPLKLFHLSPLKRSQLSFFCLCVTVRMPYAPYLLSFFPQIRRVLFFCFRNSQSATNFFFASQVEVCFFSFFCLFLFFFAGSCMCMCVPWVADQNNLRSWRWQVLLKVHCRNLPKLGVRATLTTTPYCPFRNVKYDTKEKKTSKRKVVGQQHVVLP